MLGNAMRIVTMCTLAFAICGERVGKTQKTMLSKTSRRWLAKSLLLGASVHAASGFGQPAHSASGVGRPTGVRALEPLKERIEDEPLTPYQIIRDTHTENYLKGGNEKHFEELWLAVMVKEGHKLLAKINDETSFQENEAEWKALEDDVREFQKWQEEARERYHSISHKLRTPAEIRALETLKGAMNDPVSKLLQAQRNVKAEKILDLLDAAEHGAHFVVDGIIWEDYDSSILAEILQRMKGKHLQNLWLGTT